jgi:DNA-binding NarL/FixJ family response regulator
MDEARVLVVAGSPGLCQDLLLACGRRTSVRVLGPVPDLTAALAVAKTTHVDLALVDIDREDGAGLDTVARIRDAGIRTLACTRDDRPDVATAALAAGACGVVPRSADAHTYVDALRRATAGELVLADRHPPGTAGHVRERAAALTGRELEVLRMLAQGRGTVEIAEALGISPMTVRVHVKNLLAKMHAHSKVEAVRAGWRHHLVSVPISA